ncbi:tRNA threonylcarbamoyladenosine biosynthesis protein TsaE [Alcanivorax sp. HI0083]|uniref:tRNA (adenosine(37)-N6)-threonylcarbamoyltransferase complex ATPase subunit type 1 TsaE n=1 Tax=unclassified Alcanivorax TaxID=2638842 RepID=UPI0007B848BA|nr:MULTISPECIES: tRNA (adenosine(37)-N6)-threonylcarbamoyltransferase complex ATPase subunit type 1 TsaE [unclassified Alcanivorax]KZY36550.1 tRNA threonylcarbamoyladenosine biosynthesis protein TsaE [Alcanivorax sp. HI0044]KZZ25019.1 tRNA threonylcarbamoyladenosine biosynthesis protein TsaE [Alcanivorax sp. HI0083]
MSQEFYDLPDEAATLSLGADLGHRLAAGGCVYLEGDLGAGKTTLVRGMLRGLGHEGAVKSPTYTIVEPYEIAGVHIYHFDLYRLADPEELELIGVRDYFDAGSLCLLEWPERGAGVVPTPDLTITLAVHGHGRKATLEWVGD